MLFGQEKISTQQERAFFFASLCVLVLWFVYLGKGLAGFRFDDAFITYRYGENLVLGRGLVFNEGERLMGSTAPGHALLSALVYALFGKAVLPTAMAYIGCLAWSLQVAAVFFLMRMTLGVWSGALLAGVVAAGAAGAAPWVVMETHLVWSAALWAYAMAMRERWVLAAFLAGLAALFRPDAGLFALFLALWCLWKGREQVVAAAAALLVVLLPWLSFAWFYFGSPLPQSASAKFQRESFRGYLLHELRHTAGAFWAMEKPNAILIVIAWGLALYGAIWSTRKLRKIGILWLFALAHLGAYLILRPFAIHTWHLYPSALLFVLAAWCGLVGLLHLTKKLSNSTIAKAAAALALLPMLLLVGVYAQKTLSFIEVYPNHPWLGGRQAVYKDVARFLREETSKEMRIASIEVGTLAFYADRPMHDWGGLVTRDETKPYHWSVIDRSYRKKLAKALLPTAVFRRSDFVAYLYNNRDPQVFSLPPHPAPASKPTVHPTSQASPNAVSTPPSNPSSQGAVSTPPSNPSSQGAVSTPPSTHQKASSSCGAYRGARSLLPKRGEGVGCSGVLAGTPTLAGYRDHRRWFARLHTPIDMAILPDGHLLLVELKGHRLRKIDAEGVVTTYAGSLAGDRDGSLGEARFHEPAALAVASDGTIFVAEQGTPRIRRISPQGRVETIAGSKRGFRDGKKESAQFIQPQGLLLKEDGSLLIADTGARRLRKLTPDGRVITWAGSGRAEARDGGLLEAGFLAPSRMLAHKTHPRRIWLTDALDDSLRLLEDTNDGRGGSVKTALRFAQGARPFSMAYGEGGWLYFSLLGHQQIVRWREGMPKPQWVAGHPFWKRSFLEGKLEDTLFAHPTALAWDRARGRLLVADSANHCIRHLGVVSSL